MELVKLAELARGAVGELFAEELIKVGENLTDINTDYKPARKIRLEFEFRAEDEDRREIAVLIAVKSSLAPLKRARTRLYVAARAGGIEMAEHDQRQGDLFQPVVVPGPVTATE